MNEISELLIEKIDLIYQTILSQVLFKFPIDYEYIYL